MKAEAEETERKRRELEKACAESVQGGSSASSSGKLGSIGGAGGRGSVAGVARAGGTVGDGNELPPELLAEIAGLSLAELQKNPAVQMLASRIKELEQQLKAKVRMFYFSFCFRG